MHCPACGIETSDQQKYCRSCGMDLKTISDAVIKHRAPADAKKLSLESETSVQHRVYKMLLWGIGALLAGMALIAAGKEIQYVGWVGVLLALIGTFLALFGVLYPYRPKKHIGPSTSLPSALPRAESTNQLPPESQPEFPQSITEHTTRVLEPLLRNKPKVSEGRESQGKEE